MPLGLLQGLINIKQAKKANKELDQLYGQDPTYTKNPFAAEALGMAKNLFYGRMAGAGSLEQNILGNQANTISNINRGAVDSSQALALAAGAQGQTNQAFSDLQIQEAQNKYNLLGNLNKAYGTMINEGDKEYQDKIRRFEDLASIKGAQRANKASMATGIFNGLNSDFNDAASIFGLGQGGLLSGLFGGGKKQMKGVNSGGGLNWFSGRTPGYQY